MSPITLAQGQRITTMKQVHAYYCPDGMQRFPKEISAVIEYSSDNMTLVMFRDGWTQWINQRLIEIESA